MQKHTFSTNHFAFIMSADMFCIRGEIYFDKLHRYGAILLNIKHVTIVISITTSIVMSNGIFKILKY